MLGQGAGSDWFLGQVVDGATEADRARHLLGLAYFDLGIGVAQTSLDHVHAADLGGDLCQREVVRHVTDWRGLALVVEHLEGDRFDVVRRRGVHRQDRRVFDFWVRLAQYLLLHIGQLTDEEAQLSLRGGVESLHSSILKW